MNTMETCWEIVWKMCWKVSINWDSLIAEWLVKSIYQWMMKWGKSPGAFFGRKNGNLWERGTTTDMEHVVFYWEIHRMPGCPMPMAIENGDKIYKNDDSINLPYIHHPKLAYDSINPVCGTL